MVYHCISSTKQGKSGKFFNPKTFSKPGQKVCFFYWKQRKLCTGLTTEDGTETTVQNLYCLFYIHDSLQI